MKPSQQYWIGVLPIANSSPTTHMQPMHSSWIFAATKKLVCFGFVAEPSGRHTRHSSCLLSVRCCPLSPVRCPPSARRVYECCIKKSAAERENKSAHWGEYESWVWVTVCVWHNNNYTRYSYVKCIFGPLRWPRRQLRSRTFTSNVASQATTLSLSHRLGLSSSDFLLSFLLRAALAGILSAEIYDILVGNAHLSYRNVGIALLLHKAQPRLSFRLANVAPFLWLCLCLCPCNAYFRHDLTVWSVQEKSVL